MSPEKIVSLVIGTMTALIAVGLIAGGAGLLWAYGTERADDGYFTSPTAELTTEVYALTSTDIDLGSRPGDWLPSGRLAAVRIDVESQAAPVFVGIGPEEDVDAYLQGVGYEEVTRIGPNSGDATYRSVPGGAPSALPSEQSFWAVSAQGEGAEMLSWELERGEWTVVIMNADASPGVDVNVSAGVTTRLLVPIGIALVVGGLLLGALAALLLVVALRRPEAATTSVAPVAAGGIGSYPVVLEGQLDPVLSRWKWLVKWFLAIPHMILLAFLWAAFAVLTVVAGFAILFTGRYPKSIFDFNVGVMRWTWRVSFYAYSALGTDQYPPFTLAETDYPAKFDVAYPEELSRGLVLVKWWLLALPHYVIIGLFTTGLVWYSQELNDSGNAALQIGGGLIGVLVFIAAIALTFTGRYPQGLFDVVMGLNRWVYRVWAYAALMRDEYPPFRFDAGGFEPGATTDPASGPTAGGDALTEPDLTRV